MMSAEINSPTDNLSLRDKKILRVKHNLWGWERKGDEKGVFGKPSLFNQRGETLEYVCTSLANKTKVIPKSFYWEFFLKRAQQGVHVFREHQLQTTSSPWTPTKQITPPRAHVGLKVCSLFVILSYRNFTLSQTFSRLFKICTNCTLPTGGAGSSLLARWLIWKNQK